MFSDKLKLEDGVVLKLGCGHPKVIPGEVCQWCGALTEKTEDAGDSSSVECGNERSVRET